jgi:hypothetical protein
MRDDHYFSISLFAIANSSSPTDRERESKEERQARAEQEYGKDVREEISRRMTGDERTRASGARG